MNSGVNTGYLQTDVGLIPIDWSVTRIDADALIKTGSRNTQDRVNGGEYPFYVRSQQVESINSFSYDGEAVLTAGDGVGTGKVFHYINGKFDVHQRVYRISDFSNRLHGRYFFYQFSTRFYDRIMSMTAKSSVDSVRMEMIAGMQIPLPPIPEQLAIAAALDDIESLLSSLDQLIAKKRDIQKAAMQQLLTGQRRLPGFSGEWEVKRLGDIADIDPESLPGDTPSSFEFRYISLEDVDTGNLKSYSELTFSDAPSRARRLIRKNDILVSTVRPNLMSHLLFKGEESNWVCSTGFSVVRCNPLAANMGFIFFNLFARNVNKQIDTLTTGSNYPAINSGDVRNLSIPAPNIEEQAAIATILSDMDSEISALEVRRDKARKLKQGMMQELLTGRVRLR